MMNQDNPYAMNQTCKVCGEPAAGFHFGAFTCEGCKSFFGRSYNNLSSISDCKNNGECIINKKNRTACKACRLRKCLMVGMSKSGSRYGRRSNWFKIHCLLQEQQQQAAAAMAAHQSQQQQAQHHHAAAGGMHVKPPGIPPPAAAAAALGMLGHAGAYPGLYPPRTKEELMMLSLEEYAKHPAASPSVSSPDSHNSDSSVEVNGGRGAGANSMLHLTAKHGSLDPNSAGGPATNSAVPPQLRKDLPPFLPLPFPALSSMPVIPPPSFLPPSHLLFPGYHPALYQHAHAGLLKPSPEQQAAAAAMHHLFQNTPRFHTSPLAANENTHKAEDKPESPRSDTLNNNHIPNGSKAAEEMTKRFYLDAVLKSQQSQTPPPPLVTKLPNLSKHDHSITALVTPNSESGRAHNTSRQSNDEQGCAEDKDLGEQHKKSLHDTLSNGHDSEGHNNTEEEDEEDLVVSMTPPRSPIEINDYPKSNEGEHVESPSLASAESSAIAQDNPIDLSMKAVSSVGSSASSHSSRSSGSGLPCPNNKCDSSSSDQENDLNDSDNKTLDIWKTEEIINNSVNNNNNNEGTDVLKAIGKGVKRKLDEDLDKAMDNEVPPNVAKVGGSVLDLSNKL